MLSPALSPVPAMHATHATHGTHGTHGMHGGMDGPGEEGEEEGGEGAGGLRGRGRRRQTVGSKVFKAVDSFFTQLQERVDREVGRWVHGRRLDHENNPQMQLVHH